MPKLSALFQSTFLPQDFITPQDQCMGSELSNHNALSLSSLPTLTHLIYLLLTLYMPISCVSRPQDTPGLGKEHPVYCSSALAQEH